MTKHLLFIVLAILMLSCDNEQETKSDPSSTSPINITWSLDSISISPDQISYVTFLVDNQSGQELTSTNWSLHFNQLGGAPIMKSFPTDISVVNQTGDYFILKPMALWQPLANGSSKKISFAMAGILDKYSESPKGIFIVIDGKAKNVANAQIEGINPEILAKTNPYTNEDRYQDYSKLKELPKDQLLSIIPSPAMYERKSGKYSFGNTLTILELRDQVLQNIRFASEKHGRVFANMYDISGGNPGTLAENIIDDWKHLVDDLKITESPNYLHHNGRPVLSIWGLGHRDEFSAASAREIIQWLTEDAPEKYLVSLKGGIDNKWRSHSSEWQAIYEMFDVISPWAVGRYKNNSGADSFRDTYIEPDLVRTQSKNIDYMPVVFPGFSWYNNKPFKDDGVTPNVLNATPRNGGDFFWHQIYNAIDAGCSMVYVAMYDEVDEGTAIYKLAENTDQIPVETAFVTLDMDGYDIPSDWYLRLTGEGSKMLRGEIALSSSMPISPAVSNAKYISQNVPTVMSPGTTVSINITLQNTGKTN